MIVCDTCSLINLQKAEALHLGVDMPCAKFCVGQVVVSELQTDVHVDMDWQSRCVLIEPDVDIARLASALNKFGLGPGETETLLLAKREGFCVLCDDRRARKVMEQELGGHRLAGSLGWLTHLVKNARLSAEDAFSRYEKMQSLGAFVPRLSNAEFIHIVSDESIKWPCSDTCLSG